MSVATRARHILLLLLLMSVFALSNTSPALAFSGRSAAAYSDTWALNRNWRYPNYGADCANFASQSIHSGGYSYMYFGSSAYYAWWCRYRSWWPFNGGFDNSRSWSVAHDLRRFLLADYPGGWDWGLQPTWSRTNNAQYGDLLFYDWQGDGYYDHVGVEASYWDYDPQTGLTGDVVNQHTTDRYHAIWTLYGTNDMPGTMRVDLIHIDARNL